MHPFFVQEASVSAAQAAQITAICYQWPFCFCIVILSNNNKPEEQYQGNLN